MDEKTVTEQQQTSRPYGARSDRTLVCKRSRSSLLPPCLQLGVPAVASTNKKHPDKSYYIYIHIYFVSALR